MKHSIRRIIARGTALVLAAAIMLPGAVFANFPHGTLRGDGFAQTDEVQNTYTGRPQASRLIDQIQFTDLPGDPAVQDAIIRGAALEVFRPATRQFRPNAAVTNEEAIAYALRAAGLSQQAMTRGQDEAAGLPEGSELGQIWSFGYLHEAYRIGMLTEAERDSALIGALAVLDDEAPEGEFLPLGPLFDRTAPAYRENIAAWLVAAMEYADSDTFEGTGVGLGVHNFTDWNSISANRVASVETLLRTRVIEGNTDTTFGPTSNVTRQEMAQIIRNLDRLHYNSLGLERIVGTVALLADEQFNETNAGRVWRHVYVRRADGTVDMLQFQNDASSSPQDVPLDAVVLRNGEVGGLTTLQVGDIIEYLVHTEDETVWYVQVTGGAELQVFRGRLEAINMEEGRMTFRDGPTSIYTFPMVDGLFGIRDDGIPFIRFSNELFPAQDLPRGTYYDVYLVGNVITDLIFVGDPEVTPEIRGIVIDNNPFLGSITILDQNRMERSFTYVPGQLRVQRRRFFDDRSMIGGIHQMFPAPNMRETEMDSVIAGDIVVFIVDDADPYRIIQISAAENTTTRYGRILQFRDHGGYYDMLLELNNGQTAWFTFVDGILILSHGRPVHANQIQVGDWARLIVNQASIAPGVMIESVQEVAIDGGGHHISNVVMGYLSGFDAAQNRLTIQHARTLSPAGWSNNQQLATFDLGGMANNGQAEFFNDGRQVTLAEMNRMLQRSDATVYIALENHFAGERVRMVSARSGRHELLQPDTVLTASNNSFMLLDNDGTITADPGTIVVRNGRLIDASNISPQDWAWVSLNGMNTAAVVDIGTPPVTSGVQIARARVSQVFPHQSFRVETMSIFDGFNWNFTPIAREFTIDPHTIFIGEGGVDTIDNFLGFGDDSVINDVFNVVIDGGRVSRVIDAPFTEPIPALADAPGHLTVRGIIYAIEGGVVSLRDVTVFNGRSGTWGIISTTNATGTITIPVNSIIVDRNEVVGTNRLQVGQQIMALSNEQRPATVTPGFEAEAFIVLVES